MKYIVAGCLFFAVLALTNADDYRRRRIQDLRDARAKCASHIPSELMEKIRNFDFPDEEVVRCYIQCVMEKFELFNSETGYNLENVHSQLGIQDNRELQTKVEQCSDGNEVNTDSCTWAYRNFICFAETHPLVVQTSLTKNNYRKKKFHDLMDARAKCANHISTELVEKIKKFNFPDEDVVRCYIQCVMEKLGLFNAQTGYNLENVYTQLGIHDNQELKSKVEQCNDIKEEKTDSCTWAYRNFLCFADTHPRAVQTSLTRV